VNPSPNIRNLNAALLYPGVGLLETTNVSVGRGTDAPFEWFGAPWLDGDKFAAALDKHQLPGMRFVAAERAPTTSLHAGKMCGGVEITITDRSKLEPIRLGLTIACELHRLYPNEWKVDRFDGLLLNRATVDGIQAGHSPDELVAAWKIDLDAFRTRRAKYLLYD
jgi:uncharacterized protein YbbC (DUF1343 family)